MDAIGLALEAVKFAANICQRVKGLTPMFENVRQRHERLLRRIREATPDDDTLEMLLEEQETAFTDFIAYTEEVSKYGWIRRFTRLNQIGEMLQGALDQVESTENKLADAKERVTNADWRDSKWKMARMKSDLNRMTTNMSQMSTSMNRMSAEMTNLMLQASKTLGKQASNARLLSVELKKPNALEEVTMLKYELDQRKDDYPKEHVANMDTVLRTIFNTPGFQKHEYEPWFVSTNVVAFDNTAKFEHNEIIDVQPGVYDGMTVAIKRMDINTDLRAMNQFKRELGSWTKVQHENVVRLFGACDATTPAFFVYESTVHNFYDHFKINDKKDMWHLFYQAALGLKHLHRKEIVHGDIRGENMLVGKDGLAKVSGFGFSRARQRSENLSNRPQASSDRWKAPECLGSLSEEPTWESDIYAFGVCIWEIAAEVIPFQHIDDKDINENTLHDIGLEKPEAMEDAQWEFVQSLLSIEMEKRPKINDVIIQLHKFAVIEESQVDAVGA